MHFNLVSADISHPPTVLKPTAQMAGKSNLPFRLFILQIKVKAKVSPIKQVLSNFHLAKAYTFP